MAGRLYVLVLLLEWCCISEAQSSTSRKPLGRLDLIECAALEPAEYDKRVTAGLCPPQPTKYARLIIQCDSTLDSGYML